MFTSTLISSPNSTTTARSPAALNLSVVASLYRRPIKTAQMLGGEERRD